MIYIEYYRYILIICRFNFNGCSVIILYWMMKYVFSSERSWKKLNWLYCVGRYWVLLIIDVLFVVISLFVMVF